jgi:hypothetical protein
VAYWQVWGDTPLADDIARWSLDFWRKQQSYHYYAASDVTERDEYLRTLTLRSIEMAKKVEAVVEKTMRDQFYEDLHGGGLPKNPNEKDITPEEKAEREKAQALHDRRQRDLRNIFADWLDDDGDAEASACLRYTAAEGKWPYRKESDAPESAVAAAWFNAGKITQGLGHESSDLPEDLYKLLQGGKEIANHRLYASPREAEEALVAAWKARASAE